MLLLCYTLEGIGYIIAGTFLVAAIKQHSPGWLGNGAWLVVGVAAAPSAALWAWLGARLSHPTLLAGALLLQAVGIALPAVAGGGGRRTGRGDAVRRHLHRRQHDRAGRRTPLQFRGAVALLTAGYSVGQILGPLVVTPLFTTATRRPDRRALVVVSAAVAACSGADASARAGAVRIGCRQPRPAFTATCPQRHR